MDWEDPGVKPICLYEGYVRKTARKVDFCTALVTIRKVSLVASSESSRWTKAQEVRSMGVNQESCSPWNQECCLHVRDGIHASRMEQSELLW